MSTETRWLFGALQIADFGHGTDADRALLVDAIRRDVDTLRAAGGPAPDAILVCGGLAHPDAPGAPDAAVADLRVLATACAVPDERVFIVPGGVDVDPAVNHNGTGKYVVKDARREGGIDELLANAAPKAALVERQRAVLDAAADFAPACAEPWWSATLDLPHGPIGLLGLNTALLAAGDDRGLLEVGAAQRVGQTTDRSAPLIALSHHPCTGGWLRDQADVASWLHAAADLHLSAYASEVTVGAHDHAGGRLVRCAAGIGDDGVPRFNHLAMLATPDGGLAVRIWPRTLARGAARWTVDADHVPDGGEYAEYILRTSAGAPVASAAPDPLARYRSHLRRAHAHLVPFFQHGDDPALLDAVFVELAIETGGQGRRLTLRQLMERTPRHAKHAGRWAVLGDPGSGKSTLARHLAWDLADEQSAVPIYLPLSRWAEQDGDPFDAAARELAGNCEHGQGAGLADMLREIAAEPGRVWLILDGFDELHRDRVDEIKQRITSLADAWPTVTMAVCSRRIGYQTLTGFTPAAVQPLGVGGQRELLDKWLDAQTPGAGERAMARIAAEPALIEAAGNPLLLSLMAMLVRDHPHRALPSSRGGLYGQAVDLLLSRGHCREPRGIERVHDVRFMLRALSLRLTERGGEEWSFEALDAQLEALCAPGTPLHPKLLRWGSPGGFLDAVAEDTGIIGEHNGPGHAWRFLHRSLRERLAAEALARGPAPEVAISERAQAIIDDEDALGQWGETLGVACALLDRPEGPLQRIRGTDVKLALRMLPELRGLAPQTALTVLFGIDCQRGRTHRTWSDGNGWDGDDLVALFETARWAAPASHLWPWVTPDRSLDELAFLHCALAMAGAPPDRAKFFGAAGRVLPGPGFVVPMVDIEAGGFMMGEPGQQHHVTLTHGFRLGATPVTVTQYAAFDPKHGGEGPTHPVARISWWRAHLFAAWVGGRLPTEAEWEYACRAGTATRFWSGDTEADLAGVGWYNRNSGGSTHPVAEKPANPWGLYDMHGNVREWVADWRGDYPSDPQTDPLGPPRGVNRVLRGGSYRNAARVARSAYRYWRHPADRFPYLGFRLAAPPQLDLDLDG